MEQLVQSLKDGKMNLAEVPFPALNEGCVLVRNHFSLISAGTEGKTVKDARAGYIGKARARKEEVKKVIHTARTTGVMNTYKLVMNKLEAPSPLGYCCTGEVIEVSPEIRDLKIGDIVACGGATANHAEVISVPRNLCVKVPEQCHPEAAGMTTMGAIALQGIRQADLRVGENCIVIGLGLLGQLTLQLLEASGVKAIGVDIDSYQVTQTQKNGLNALDRNNETIKTELEQFTDGFGADAVIITAGTDSTDPVDFAGEIARQKGKVVIVGAVPTGFKRTHYFKKELDLKMSCSYGPGRYDTDYEEHGIDYPIGYVRWTENRNMQAFLELAAAGKIHPEKLITHRFAFENCVDAYDLITEKKEKFLGIILKYNLEKFPSNTVASGHKSPVAQSPQAPVIGIIGAGSFARNIMLPAVKAVAGIYAVATSKPQDARYAADKFGIEKMYSSPAELFSDSKINTILIATRHDSHFNYVMDSLETKKNVFVEKPLCLSEEELNLISEKYESGSGKLMVGFNRRFSPLIQTLADKTKGNTSIPVAINYRINSGEVPPSHWVHDIHKGGGRVVGEVCHFIDLTTYLTRSKVSSVSAVTMEEVHSKTDTVAINLLFENGSIANISYFSNGNPSVNKESIEVFFGGNIAQLDDFSNLKITGASSYTKKVSGQNKGHKEQFREFIQSIEMGTDCPIPFGEIYHSMLTTFRVIESIKMKGARLKVHSSE